MGLPGQLGCLCRWMLLLITTKGAGKLHSRTGMPCDSCSHSQTARFKWCSTLHCKSNPPSFFSFSLSLFFFFALLSSHLLTTPNPNWDLMLRARWSSECIQPDDFHMSRALLVKEVNSLQKPPKNKALEKGSTLLAHSRRKGGLSLYQFMLQHISVVNLFVESWLKNCICSPLLKSQGKKNQISSTLVCCKPFNRSLWGSMVWSLPQLKWFFFSPKQSFGFPSILLAFSLEKERQTSMNWAGALFEWSEGQCFSRLFFPLFEEYTEDSGSRCAASIWAYFGPSMVI